MKLFATNIIYILFMAIILCSCGKITQGDNKDKQASPYATAKSEQTPCEKPVGNLSDKTGSSYFRSCMPVWAYSQVYGDAYYYLLSDGKSNYTVMRDEKEVGRFSIEDGIIASFVVDADNAYAIVHQSSAAGMGYLVRIDYKKRYVEKLELDFKLGWVFGDSRFNYMQVQDGKIFFDNREQYSLFEANSGEYKTGQFSLCDTKGKSVIPLVTTKELQQALPYVNLVGNVFVYAIEKDGKINIFNYDMQSRKQNKIAEIKPEQKSKGNLMVYVDGNYIYCKEYAIPVSGGRPERILDAALVYYNGSRAFSTNSKYIYFLDKQYHLKRYNKKTGKIKGYGKAKYMSVDCTENYVYVKEYKEAMLSGYTGEDCYYDDDVEDPDVNETTKLRRFK